MRLVLVLIILGTSFSYGQFVAKMEVKEPMEGLCNEKEVYALFLMLKGQEEAVCPVTKEIILERLNNEVRFLKDNPKHSDKGMIGLIINCKGQVIKCKMDNKTRHEELDKQIEQVFNTLGEWKAGKLDNEEVDTLKLFSFKIKKGQFLFD